MISSSSQGFHEIIKKKLRTNYNTEVPTSSQTIDDPADAETDDSSADKNLIQIRSASYNHQGQREYNEDRIVNLDLKKEYPKEFGSYSRAILVCVFDGHAGSKTVDYLKDHFVEEFVSGFYKCITKDANKKSFKKAIQDTFKDLDEKILWKNYDDGSTCLCAFILNNTLYIINTGDSIAVLCSQGDEGQKYKILQLNNEHKPEDPAEAQRIEESGGVIKKGRVHAKSTRHHCNFTRSFGDPDLKDVGVTCIPEVRKLNLTDDDKFLLVGSDGVWQPTTFEENCAFVLNRLQEYEGNKGDNQNYGEDIGLRSICKDFLQFLLQKMLMIT